MTKSEKLVDTKQYCIYLTEAPKSDEKSEYKTGDARKFYICALSAEPCIARHLEDRTQDDDVFGYAKPKIDEEKLKKCYLCNVPKDLAKQIMINKINTERDKKIADLEKRLGYSE